VTKDEVAAELKKMSWRPADAAGVTDMILTSKAENLIKKRKYEEPLMGA